MDSVLECSLPHEAAPVIPSLSIDPRPAVPGLLALVVREWVARGDLPRREPRGNLFQDPARAADFFATAAVTLPPIDHLNALAVSRRAPRGGRVWDLGCGSGRFLIHLARLRPDLRLEGWDASPAMVALGRDALAAEGLTDRVALRIGDMWRRPTGLMVTPDIVVSQFVLHDLPDEVALVEFFRYLAELRSRGAALWAFDFARPRCRWTLENYGRVFMRGTSALNLDSTRRGLSSAWSPRELETASRRACLSWNGRLVARGLPLVQALWSGSPRHPAIPAAPPDVFTKDQGANFRAFAWMFPEIKKMITTPFYTGFTPA